jgi:predicted restriction endonuclease
MFRNFNDPQYKKWRLAVYKRDKHQCRWPNCNSKKKLNAHHIKTWAQFPGLRFDVNNGITLCKYHHDLIRGMEEDYSYSLLMLLLRNKENPK